MYSLASTSSPRARRARTSALPCGRSESARRAARRHPSSAWRPYRLRGSFVSLLLWEGRSVTYVAAQAGHSLQTLSRHYAGVLAELEDADIKLSATDAIRAARQSVWTRRTPPEGVN